LMTHFVRSAIEERNRLPAVPQNDFASRVGGSASVSGALGPGSRIDTAVHSARRTYPPWGQWAGQERGQAQPCHLPPLTFKTVPLTQSPLCRAR
jgi:hypothetical protein